MTTYYKALSEPGPRPLRHASTLRLPIFNFALRFVNGASDTTVRPATQTGLA